MVQQLSLKSSHSESEIETETQQATDLDASGSDCEGWEERFKNLQKEHTVNQLKINPALYFLYFFHLFILFFICRYYLMK